MLQKCHPSDKKTTTPAKTSSTTSDPTVRKKTSPKMVTPKRKVVTVEAFPLVNVKKPKTVDKASSKPNLIIIPTTTNDKEIKLSEPKKTVKRRPVPPRPLPKSVQPVRKELILKPTEKLGSRQEAAEFNTLWDEVKDYMRKETENIRQELMPSIKQQKDELIAMITAKDQEIEELTKRKKMLEDEREKQEFRVEVSRSAVNIYEELIGEEELLLTEQISEQLDNDKLDTNPTLDKKPTATIPSATITSGALMKETNGDDQDKKPKAARKIIVDVPDVKRQPCNQEPAKKESCSSSSLLNENSKDISEKRRLIRHKKIINECEKVITFEDDASVESGRSRRGYSGRFDRRLTKRSMRILPIYLQETSRGLRNINSRLERQEFVEEMMTDLTDDLIYHANKVYNDCKRY